MKQMTLAAGADQGAGFEQYRKPTRREAFLATIV
ncbi:IS5/IS1182 family transposase, partial [Cupriavidus sp. AcVe19-6a]|nr:IS5/IS1182 family transposase [Cupriavidus sp. AcVe19-6a]